MKKLVTIALLALGCSKADQGPAHVRLEVSCVRCAVEYMSSGGMKRDTVQGLVGWSWADGVGVPDTTAGISAWNVTTTTGEFWIRACALPSGEVVRVAAIANGRLYSGAGEPNGCMAATGWAE